MISETRLWTERMAFVLSALAAILLALMPMGLTAQSWPMPDLLFCLIFAWVLRRPVTAPFPLVALAALMADLLLMRPLGLWAMITLGISEYYRTNERAMREHMFLVEWLFFAAAFVSGLIVYIVLLNVVLADTPGLGRVAVYAFVTIASYPLVTAALHWIGWIRAPRSIRGMDRLGQLR